MATAPLTVQNAPGRPFSCRTSHSVPGFDFVCHAGDTGTIFDYSPERSAVKARVYHDDDGHYHKGFALIQHLDIGPIAAKANTEGHPFRCVESITNSSKFTVEYLDEGSIVEYDERSARAKVSIPSKGKRGWVKLTHLHIGRARKYGDVAVDTGFLPRITATLYNRDISSTDFPITSLLFPLFCSIMDQQGKLTWLPSWSRTVLPDHASALDLARRIAKGVDRAGLTDGYRTNSRWTWRDFVSHGTKINPSTAGIGIYGRYYSNFRFGMALFGAKARLYIGKTTRSFGQRYNEHKDATINPQNADYNNSHYRIARQADVRNAIIEAFLDNMSESETAFAEQALILIKRAYRPEVINWAVRVDSGQPGTSAATTVEDVEAEIISNLEDKEPATQLTQLAEDLWAKIGWTDRLDTSGGCNKQSPLGESGEYEKILWTMIDFPDRYVYYRAPYQWFTGANTNVLFKKNNWTHDNKKTVFEIRRGKDHPIPPKGASVYFSVEIMKNGRHPQAYSRLPDVGIWSNWAEANQVALHMRWKEGQQWYSFYLQWSQDALHIQDTMEPGSILVYTDMINFRHYLERKTFTTPLPWADKWGIARVKQIHFDFLGQAVQITDPPAPMPAVVLTPMRLEPSLRANYQQLGLLNYGKIRTDTSLSFRALDRAQSTLCDECYILTHRHKFHPESYKSGGVQKAEGAVVLCVTEADNSTCTYCRHWGHRCTFSKLDKKKALALHWYPPRPNVANKIGDPGFENHTLAN